MSKNKKVQNTEDIEVVVPDEKQSTKDKKNNKDKSKNKNTKPKKERKSLWRIIKETFAELKKVSWPSFGKVVKQTCVVILVVAICTLILFGTDRLFSLLYNALINGL